MDVERTIEFLMEHAARNQAEIEALTDRIVDLNTAIYRVSGNLERVVGIQERQAELLEQLMASHAGTDSRLDRLTERVDKLAEGQERTDYAIRALMDSVDRILPRLPPQ
jgi:predicted  nucleic acid-binding Zn-ribbon protein